MPICIKYGLPFLLFGLGCFFQVVAQEQMTNYQGDPCCFYASELLELDSHTLVIAKDNQKGVEIYQLLGKQSILQFSNRSSEKFDLLSQGRLQDFYFLLYKDRLELFYFDSLHLKTYPFPEPLDDLQAGEGGGVRMTKYGLLLIPENQQDSMRFFNLHSRKFEMLTNSVGQGDYPRFLDSFMYFKKELPPYTTLLSHNLLTDEVQRLHTTTSNTFSYSLLESLVFFKDNRELYLSRGRKNNTYLLAEHRFGHSNIKADEDNGNLAILSAGDEEWIDYYLFSRNGNPLYEKNIVDVSQAFITRFSVDGEENILFSTAFNQLYALEPAMDTLNYIDEIDPFAFYHDGQYCYYLKDNNLWRYDFSNGSKSEISEQSYEGQAFQLLSPDNNVFYLRGLYGYEHSTIAALDLNKNELIYILPFTENTEGNKSVVISKVGSRLILTDRNDIPQYVLQNDEFQAFPIAFTTTFIDCQGKVYALGLDHTLYEWVDESNFEGRINDLPLLSDEHSVYCKHNQLFAEDSEGNLILLDIEGSNYNDLTPPTANIERELFYTEHPDYFILRVLDSAQNESTWSYNVRTDVWKQIGNGSDLIDNRGYVQEHMGEQFVWSTQTATEINLYAADLKTGEKNKLESFSSFDEDAVLSTFAKCPDGLIMYYHHDEPDNYIQQLYLTDGTVAGTEFLDSVGSEGSYQIPYFFEGKLYFTLVDSFEQTVMTFECKSGLLKKEDWSRALITQGQYRLGDRIFLLGNNLFPRQNLTIAERSSMDIIEIYQSTIGLGFVGGAYDGGLRREVPVLKLNDSILALVDQFDRTGEELWFLYANGRFERRFDLNPGPFDAEIQNLVVHENYLYFKGYRYGPGNQIWRTRLDSNTTSAHNFVEQRVLKISPNPLNNRFRLHNVPLGKGQLWIMNSGGKVIFHGQKAKGDTQPEYHIGTQTEGVYYVLLIVDGKKYTATLVKIDK